MVKLSDYGMTQGESTEGRRSTALYQPLEVFKGKREMKSDVWSLGIALIEMMGLTPYVEYKKSNLPIMDDLLLFPFRMCDVESKDVAGFLRSGLEGMHDKWTVNDLLFVSVMGWRMMSRIRL